jgi:hypothetical protein
MGMIASLFQIGDKDGAEKLSSRLHEIDVKIIPPKSALSFKAFLRYRSPPAIEDKERGLDETGSYYLSRPHMREYSIFQNELEVYVRVPEGLEDYVKKSLKNLRYLGSKDSLVTCFEISESDAPPKECCINKLEQELSGTVVLLADFKPNSRIQKLTQLIPGNRNEEMYERTTYTMPRKIITKGKTRILVSSE